jgi:predicted nuclease of predicted toxin-antitoxin system
MRILLDENMDWRLRRLLPGHEVDSVAYIGWSGMKNGALLRKAADAGYEVLITMDGNFPYQQDLAVHAKHWLQRAKSVTASTSLETSVITPHLQMFFV